MPSNAQDFKKSNELKATPAAQWKKSGGAKPVDIALPSGNVAKVRQIPMPTLLADGLFPDSLQVYIRKAIGEETKAANGPKTPQDKKSKKSDKKQDMTLSNEDMQEMMSNPETLSDLFAVFDKVLVLAVVEPKVHPAPVEDEEGNIPERDDSLLYADEVDMEDKAFVFQFTVGGSKEIDRFRAESSSLVGGLADIPGVQIAP